MRPQVVQGDLLDQKVDVIVNAWNRNVFPWWLLIPQGVSKAIRKRAGKGPFRELSRMGLIPLGGAVLTTPGKLPYRGIIHVAGINLLWFATEQSIRRSVRSAMTLVDTHHFSSVAFPIIGSGSGNRSRAKALEFMLAEFKVLNSDAEALIVEYMNDALPSCR